jgi:flagellar hook protein FlgE
MSISAAMQAALAGLNGQAAAIGFISDNVANASTPGYKKVESRFSTLITQSSAQANSHSPGGVQNRPFFANNAQGPIQQVASGTSFAVSGDGFIPVSKQVGIGADGQPVFEQTAYYTRVGDFTQNTKGYLVNSSGYYLQGWAVDPVTGAVDTSQTREIRVSDLLDQPVQTSQIEYSATLPANALDADGNLPATLPVSSFQVYDALGNARTLNLTWTRTAASEWELTIDAPGSTPSSFGPATVSFGGDVNGTAAPAGTISGLGTGGGLTGTVGTALGDDASFSLDLDFGSGPQAVRFDLGSFGSTNGTTQFGGTTLQLNDLQQNGVPQGNYKSLAIDANGMVSVTFDNGNVKTFYQVPLAKFRDPTELDRVDGNAFVATPQSGSAVLGQAGGSGVGDIVASAIEQSNVDIAEEFAKMIVAQRAYSANARLVTVADELLQETLNISR